MTEQELANVIWDIKVGCEFPFTRVFYIYRPLRSASEILADLQALDRESDAELSTLISEEA